MACSTGRSEGREKHHTAFFLRLQERIGNIGAVGDKCIIKLNFCGSAKPMHSFFVRFIAATLNLQRRVRLVNDNARRIS